MPYERPDGLRLHLLTIGPAHRIWFWRDRHPRPVGAEDLFRHIDLGPQGTAPRLAARDDHRTLTGRNRRPTAFTENKDERQSSIRSEREPEHRRRGFSQGPGQCPDFGLDR